RNDGQAQRIVTFEAKNNAKIKGPDRGLLFEKQKRAGRVGQLCSPWGITLFSRIYATPDVSIRLQNALDAQAFVALLELRDATAAVNQRLRATGPCRVGVRVDVELQGCTFFAPGGAGRIFGAVRQN